MAIYYVNNQPHQNGVHEVHISTCSSYKRSRVKISGYFDRAAEAVFAASSFQSGKWLCGLFRISPLQRSLMLQQLLLHQCLGEVE